MQLRPVLHKLTIFPLLAFFFTLFALFPTSNSSIDAYYYAASVKHAGEIFHPHHLLYNLSGFSVFRFMDFIGLTTEVLPMMKMLNAIAGTVALYMLYLILRQAGRTWEEASALVFLAGSSFGFMRYCCENETYILPLVFSLAASLYFLRFFRSGKPSGLFWSGFFAALAILFHQLHVFWWIGLFAGTVWLTRNFRMAAAYLSPALLIPVCYSLCAWYETGELSIRHLPEFVFSEYCSGGATIGFQFRSAVLSIVSLVRTFFQVHGNILYILKANLLNALIIPACVACLAAAFLLPGPLARIRKPLPRQQACLHGAIFVLHFLFAMVSSGNAEFMVMLPFLAVISVGGILKFNNRAIILTAVSMLLWNFSFGVFPAYKHRYSVSSMLLEKIRENRDGIFILRNDQQLVAKNYYETGSDRLPGLLKAPSDLTIRGADTDSLRRVIRQEFLLGKKVFTDCLDRPVVINREYLLDRWTDEEFFSEYLKERVDSFGCFYGKYYLTRIRERD